MTDIFLDRYEALSSLGRGSMGQVFLARPTSQPDQRVVVKVMHDRVARQPRFKQLFEREIQFMGQLRHPYATRLIDASPRDPAGPCLVMEYVKGTPLDALMQKEKRFSPERTGRLLGCLCHALDAAHALGIVHRDLKPANLMIVDVGTSHESLRVMDFGLAHLTQKPHISAERLAGAAVNLAFGTPSYICPEQLRGDEVDARGDIYSVGVILFEMLTGTGPYPQTDTQQLLHAHVHDQPLTFALAGVRDVPPQVEHVVQLCLSKFANERPQTARELAERYGRAIAQDIWEATRPTDIPEEIDVGSPPPLPKRKEGPAPPTTEQRGDSIIHRLEAYMPERIAVVKLRGFLEDYGGEAVASEPGLLRIRIGQPHRGNLLTFLGLSKHRPDPIEIEFLMEKPESNGNRLQMTITFRPPGHHVLRDPEVWQRSCENLLHELKSYLIAHV
jgi:eukaryotic-like serine/threonine-protein kinase